MTETPSGTGYGYIRKSNTGAVVALRAACSGINKMDNTHQRGLTFYWLRVEGLAQNI